jgi:DNA-directed RNA polymerase alpha subunit
LSAQIETLVQGKPINWEIYKEAMVQNQVIEELDLSVRSYNCLKRTGINYSEDLLKFDSIDKLITIRNLGRKSIFEVASKMRELGYIKWANKVENTTSAHTEVFAQGTPIISPEVQEILEEGKLTIHEMDFSPCIFNALIIRGIKKAEDLLKFDSIKSITEIRGLGKGAVVEIVSKMREHGFTEGADEMKKQYRLKESFYEKIFK